MTDEQIKRVAKLVAELADIADIDTDDILFPLIGTAWSEEEAGDIEFIIAAED